MKEKKFKHSIFNVNEYWDREDLIKEEITDEKETPEFVKELHSFVREYKVYGNRVVEYVMEEYEQE